MSDIFITEIVGQNDFAIPANDAALGTATTELDALLTTVANLSYKRVLAWVNDAGGPDGAEGVRSLNCLVEQFEYSNEECPDATETATMTAAIESTLEADADITSIGAQQVHVNLKDEYYFWERDTGSEFVYTQDPTDDIGVGGSTPNGKWFQDGDLVLGGNTMSGTEVLRVVGTERIEGGLLMVEQAAVPLSPAAGEATYWVFDNGASVNVPYFTDDAPADHRLAYESEQTSLFDIDRVIFVDQTSGVYVADGTIQKPYNTIGAAITAAAALNPDVNGFGSEIQGTAPNMTLRDTSALFTADMVGHYVTITNATTDANEGTFLITGFVDATRINYENANGVAEVYGGMFWIERPVGIVVYPGIYNEGLVVTNSFISLIGIDRDSTIVRQSSGTVNPLTCTRGNTLFKNITFEVDGTHTDKVVHTNIPSSATFGHGDIVFENCNFLGTAGAAGNYFYPDGYGDHYFYNCLFKGATNQRMWYSGSAAGDSANFFDCDFIGQVHQYHQQAFNAFGSSFYVDISSGGAIRFTFGGIRRFWNCHIRNPNVNGWGVQVTGAMDPAGEFYNTSFEVGSNGYAINGNNVGWFVISGCPMNRGMSWAAMQRVDVRYAGGQAGDEDWYIDLANALSLSSPTNDGTVVIMQADYTGGGFTLPSNVDLTIDGQGEYTIQPTGDISTNQGNITLRDLKYVGQFDKRWSQTTILERVRFEGLIDMPGSIGAGDDLIIHDCVMVGTSSNIYPIYFRWLYTYDLDVIISKSYLKGYTGAPAIWFDSRSDPNIKIEYSKIFHGSGGTNNPFGGYGTGTVYAAHHTVFGQEPALADPANITNDIDSAQRHNTIDPDGDFDTFDDPF
jgi:hypothetical protein